VRQTIETQRTRKIRRDAFCDPLALERDVRQLLADKVNGTLVGLWLLVPEHLRLGTWDLLCRWAREPGTKVGPRLALQLTHEAALCVTGVRRKRTLGQRGFELANGLPFVASDQAMQQLLAAHAVADAQELQVVLGQLRRASGHYRGRLLAIDPHRIRSYTKRQVRRHRSDSLTRPFKVAQTFFALDVDTGQPLCFTSASAARTVSEASPELLDLAARILGSDRESALVLADTEHCTREFLAHVQQRRDFDILVPMASRKAQQKRLAAIPPDQFTRRWAGYATTTLPYPLGDDQPPLRQIVQRKGERADDFWFKSFLTTGNREPDEALTNDYPKRWHVEEFFNAEQALGWNRAGTQNLNIRYNQMTMALVAQTLICQLRKRLGAPVDRWSAPHLAKSLFTALDGDIRVRNDTIIVTYYNAPNVALLRPQYEHLPRKLADEGVDPRIPWLYGFKLDFRFR